MMIESSSEESLPIDHEDDIHWEDLNVAKYIALNGMFIFCYDSCLHPFDVVKTRQQFDQISAKPLSSLHTAQLVVRKRGFRGLFTGLRPSMTTNMPGHLVCAYNLLYQSDR